MTLALGTVLESRYRIAALLGQGGMGAVYRAHDLRLQQDVALKENRMASPASTRQFEREAVLMARLRHPNLPRVMDHFVAPDGAQYLVMDYIAGEDLGQILARNGPLDERLALAWIERVCDALAYLHSQTPPIVHRDIKPGNIKITPQGEVYLVDFGIAKVGDAHQRTTVGALGVTPGFSPPEQYGGGGTDPRSDIYALGATLYTLVTNECPPESVLRSIKMAALRPPQELRPDLSATVAAALESALATSPTDRPQSVEAFRALLRQRAAESPADHAGRGATLLKEPEPPADAAGPPWVVTPASAQPPSAPAHKRSTPSVVESPVAPQAVAATPAASTPQASAAPVSAPLRPPTPQGAATPAARVKKPPRARQGRLLGGWVWAGVAVAGVLLIVAAVAVALALTSNRDRALPTEAVPETGPTEETQPPAATGGEQPVEPEEGGQQAPDETPAVAPVTAPQVELLAVYGHGTANSVAYAPDGRYLAVASSLGVHLFETGGNRLVYTFGTTTAMGEVAFSRDSALIAAGGNSGGPVLVWRMEDAALVHRLEDPPAGAFSLGFAPDGRTLAMSSWGQPPRLWRLGTDEPPQPLEGTSVDPQPYGVAFSADGELVAGGCQEAS
ncbi:MAG: protein kinase, partial [Anaerolineales bacterium]|nr:protein kinase [Anaerolineales bacterium]